MNLYAATLLILFVNVFTHAGQTVLFGMYTPGVVTGDIDRPALHGDCVSFIESPPPVEQDNLENEPVHVRRDGCRHIWPDDHSLMIGPCALVTPDWAFA